MWCLSIVISGVLTVCSELDQDLAMVSIIMVTINLVHTLPTILLTVIYTKIFRAAHNNSERARRNSAVR